MSSCIFTKHGLKTVQWSDDKEEIFLEKHPARHINHYCEIEKGVTLKKIMNVVANDEVLSAIMSIYSDIQDIKGWHAELNRKARRDNDLSHIEIFRDGQIYKKDIQIWIDWTGVFKRKQDGGKKASLSYCELCTIAHLPVKLNTKFKIWAFGQNKKKEKPIIDYKTNFTMLEVLHPIYYDIGFHGGPKDRDIIKTYMKNGLKDILNTKIVEY